MHGSVAAGWPLVALCVASGAYCLLRMRSRLEEQRRAAGGEALMGFGMALMALPATVVTPPRWAWLGYAVVFGGTGVRALWAARTDTHHLHHLVGALAMAYMAVAMATAPGAQHAGHAGQAEHATPAGPPLLTGALLLYFAAYVVWSGVRLLPVTAAAGQPGGRTGPPGWGDRPEVARACRLSMGIAMLAMLLPA